LKKGNKAMSATQKMSTYFDLSKLFGEDELTPAQYYATTRRTYHINPELRLMAAVLEDAVATLTTDQRRCSGRQRRDFEEALRWINAADETDWVFSFRNICESLGIEPDFLRTGLLRKSAAISRGALIAHRAKGRHESPRRKVVRLRVG
jgi:hypothetical protein